ncbi:LicD family protein [Aquisalimonas asiatica]|nr:LicD family protein [Aquisalimonas asiatica]
MDKEDILDREAIHRRLLWMLTEVSSILENAGVCFFISHGTLLGAVRHKGFIPWDDDIDLHILSDDLPCALQALQDHLPPELTVLHRDPAGLPVDVDMRISDRATVLSPSSVEEETSRSCSHSGGLFVDVLEMPRIRRSQRWAYSGIKWARNRSRSQPPGLRRIATNLVGAVSSRVFGITACLPGRYVFVVSDRWSGGMYDVESILPVTDLWFEGEKMPAPRDYRKVLSGMYGDYEKIPEMHTRKMHFQECYRKNSDVS